MARRRVVAYLKGGLGNQCFIYAAARTLALKSNAELCFNLDYFERDKIYKRKYALDSFNVVGELLPLRTRSMCIFEKMRNKIVSTILKRSNFGNYWCDHMPFIYRPLPTEWDGDLLLDGYWHSFGYYGDGFNQVLNDFSLKDDKWFKNDNVYKRVISDQRAFFCHVRSYKEVPGHASGDMSASVDYYHQALKIMAKKFGCDANCYLFSDDLSWSVERLKRGMSKLNINIIPVENEIGVDNQLRDFMLMSYCAGGIVGNSSFSGFAGLLAYYRKKLSNTGVFISPSGCVPDYFPPDWMIV